MAKLKFICKYLSKKEKNYKGNNHNIIERKEGKNRFINEASIIEQSQKGKKEKKFLSNEKTFGK